MEDFVNDEEAQGGNSVEAILDELLPEELEWERLVRAYPVPALALAAVGGFVVALRHGPEILSAVSGFLAAEVSRNVGELLGQ
ncbi:MAG TPA: hypothetical protein VN493_26070 [Thermoanaerobaculia bacterium]|nr:hypothetical protein [Thermoanaerobaculia bacterium]